MILSKKGWQNLFLICLGLFLGTTFCMKWMETGFFFKDTLFTIIGLEISYPGTRLMDILHNVEEPTHTLLKAHLYFDFAFMAGAYGGIASMLMLSRYRIKGIKVRRILLALAVLQLIAWGCDIKENLYLLHWMETKQYITYESIKVYHSIVIIKWTLALIGVFVSIPILLFKKATV